jgi:hypothetical protein
LDILVKILDFMANYIYFSREDETITTIPEEKIMCTGGKDSPLPKLKQ